MSLTADFYAFAKRKNSTKQPTGTPTSLSVDLKSGTSFISPTFLLSYSGRPPFNYLSFGGGYYFVKDIISVRNDLWELVCEIDPLATLKTEVLATTAYVLYDSVSNTEIPDNRLPMITTETVSVNSVTCPLEPSSGIFILSLTGSHGSTGVYKVTASELADLIDDLTWIQDNIFDLNNIPVPSWPSSPSGNTIPEWLDFVGQCLGWVGDWIDYAVKCAIKPVTQFFGSGSIPENIRECKFIPFSVGNATLSVSPVYLGSFETQQTLYKLTSETQVLPVSVNIPWQTTPADYRRRSPYTEIYLYLPYIGMTRLSSENLTSATSLNISYCIGLRDGDLIVTVKSDTGEVLGQYSGNVAASVPVGMSNINPAKAAQSILSMAASAIEGNIPNAGMAGINFADSVTPNFSTIGGLDGVAGIGTDQKIRCYTVYHDTIVPPNTGLLSIGSPTMAPKQLSTLLSGYCQCMGAHVEAAAPSVILAMVDNYLNSGFFIE